MDSFKKSLLRGTSFLTLKQKDLKELFNLLDTFNDDSLLAFSFCSELDFQHFETRVDLYSALKRLWPKYSSEQKQIMIIKAKIIIAEDNKDFETVNKLNDLYLLLDFIINNP